MEKEFNIFGEFESEDLEKIVYTETEDPAHEEEEDETPEETSKETPEEEDPEEDPEEVEDLEDEEEEESEESGYNFKALASALAEEGVIDYEASEEDDNSIELISNAVTNTAKSMLEEYKESIPEQGRKFLDYLEKGGDPNKFFETISSSKVTDLDIEDESNQKRIISEYLKLSDYSDEEIAETLQDYEDGLILEKQAKLASKRLGKIYEKEEEKLIKSQEESIKAEQKKFDEYVNTIKTSIDSADSLAGLKISKAEKKSLQSYILDKDKTGLTQWQKDLQENATQTQLELAFLKMKKFNFENITAKTKTDITKKYKSIFDGTDKTPKGRSKQYTTKP